MKREPSLSYSDSLLLRKKRVGILVAQWHNEITSKLESSATNYLRSKYVSDIFVHYVPGCFELPLAAKLVAKRAKVDAIVAIGCVIQGETPHFTYVCRACCDGLLQVSLEYQKPLGLGVITAKTLHQAEVRSSSEYNKGQEAASAVAKMLVLTQEITLS